MAGNVCFMVGVHDVRLHEIEISFVSIKFNLKGKDANLKKAL